jgi:hypothetical protein
MKSIFESAEVMAAYAEIDFGYLRLKMLNEELQKEKPLTPIEAMIDKATGYDKVQYSELKRDMSDILETIIKNKKFIEADFENDEKALEQLKNML